MHPPVSRFWAWYERYYFLNVTVSTALFLLQAVHLYWMLTHVIFQELFGWSFFSPGQAFELVLVAVDYTEIPALIGTSLIYINDLRKDFRWKPVFFLVFLNIQWLHLFWITDEFVVEQLTGDARQTILPLWLAWVAIGIDFLEVPVMIDTTRKAAAAVLKKFSLPARSRSR